MKLAGWETASVFRRYAIVNEADLTEATKRLAASRGAQAHHEHHGADQQAKRGAS